MSSIVGTKVKGTLGRPGTDFVGVVVEEYRVATGLMTGTPMATIETTDGRTVYSFRAYLTPVTVPDGSFSGDLESVLTEMDGHAADCDRSYDRTSHLIAWVANTYDGGLFAFLMNTSPLWCDDTVTVRPTAFGFMFNVWLGDTKVGHVRFRPDTGTWNGYRQNGDVDEWLSGGFTRDQAVDNLVQCIGNLSH